MKKLFILLLLVAGASPLAADEPLRLTLRDHKFVPEQIEAPAHVKFKLLIKNEGDSAIEWESDELDREEMVEPGEERGVFLGPLEPGTYPFYDDRHQATKGTLIVK